MARNPHPVRKPAAKAKPKAAPESRPAGGRASGWPETVSTADMMLAFGLKERFLRDLMARGYLPHAKLGRWGTLEAVQGMCRYLREQANGGGVTLSEARLAREKAKARTATVEADLAEGKVVPIDEARMMFAQCGAKVKTRLLAIPSSVAPKLVGLSVPDMDAKIQAEIVDGLADLDRTRI